MPSVVQARAMAARLCTALAQRNMAAGEDEALELVAAQLGYDDWAAAAAALAPVQVSGVDSPGAEPDASVVRSEARLEARSKSRSKSKSRLEAMSGPSPEILFTDTIPILRMFDQAKAREFYCDFLGFAVQFEYRFAPDLPLYMEVARAGMRVHLSEHHGDSSPGTTLFVPMQGVIALHQELVAKRYGFGRPGIENLPWGDVLEVHDPFGNRIRFCQQDQL